MLHEQWQCALFIPFHANRYIEILHTEPLMQLANLLNILLHVLSFYYYSGQKYMSLPVLSPVKFVLFKVMPLQAIVRFWYWPGRTELLQHLLRPTQSISLSFPNTAVWRERTMMQHACKTPWSKARQTQTHRLSISPSLTQACTSTNTLPRSVSLICYWNYNWFPERNLIKMSCLNQSIKNLPIEVSRFKM